jgi:hypothetical protein
MPVGGTNTTRSVLPYISELHEEVSMGLGYIASVTMTRGGREEEGIERWFLVERELIYIAFS